MITLADSVCWLLNIRGHDVPHTPFTLAFAILHDDGGADLFLDPAKRTPELMAHLGNAVQVHDPAQFTAALDAMKDRSVLVDPSTAASAIFDRLAKAGAKIRQGSDPCQLPKACKNSLEIEGMRKAHIRDGAALARFLSWFESNAAGGELTEIQVAETLEGYRRATGCLSDVSFDTISGAGPNGAIVHYRVTRSTNRTVHPGDMFLLDSGAQYPDGTTDVTRTIMVGEATPEMRDRFTRVLKGHIALATARFPEGTIGMQLDSFARRPLWEAGLDYDHGTGHGVGSYLSVHEGPQNISKKPVMQALEARHGLFQRARLLQDRRLRHPHRESGGGDRARGCGRRTADDGIRDHHPGADRPQPGRAVAADRQRKRLAQSLSRPGARRDRAAGG